MTIKQIAELANVSISTVSKILNGKDSSIGKETREKVLKIAKEYHYTPYESMLGDLAPGKFMLGVVCQETEDGRAILAGISEQASEAGYLILCSSYKDAEGERKALARLHSQNISGAIWQRYHSESIEHQKALDSKGIPLIYVDDLNEGKDENQLFADYGHLGYEMAEYLLGKNHREIACVYPEESVKSERFQKGIQKCLYKHGMTYKKENFQLWTNEFSVSDLVISGVTAVICFDERIAGDVYRKAAENGYQIPEDFSVISAGGSRLSSLMNPPLTTYHISQTQVGREACRHLVGKIEKTEIEKESNWEFFTEGKSVQTAKQIKAGKIVVIGSINVDSVINVGDFPNPGQTIVANHLNSMPGGKGSNQAVGAAKMGAQVYMIGKLGQDYEAKVMRDAMGKCGVNLEGVSETAAAGTGKAFITVQSNGESNIIVYPGANQYLSKEDIEENESTLENAQFCLLQLETPAETVEYAAALAQKHGAQVILKPAAVSEISDELLKNTDFFVPNKKELDILLAGRWSLEKKAEYFIKKGVKHVIVTLGGHGCYLKDAVHSLYFSAGDFKAVDTTGAADAFIAALATYLCENIELVTAIQYASYAAGSSVARAGVQSAMMSRSDMDLCIKEIGNTIQIGEKGLW